MPRRRVEAAHAAAAGSTPRLNAFSANQTDANPFASAIAASSIERWGSIPPCRRTLNRCRSTMGLNAARALGGAGLRKMCMHHAPIATFLAKHHGRAGDEFVAAVMDVLRWRLLAGPIAPGAAMAPDHGHVAGNDPADVEWRPVARLHVSSIELPELEPVVASLIGMPIEIEEHRLRRLAPDRIELLPIESGVRIDIVRVQFQELLAIALRASDEIWLGHFLLRR